MSLNENGNSYFGPKSVLLYGAASFLYELYPCLGDQGKPDQQAMSYFFIREQLPANYSSRATPYTIPKVASKIFKQYQLHSVAFGGNTGTPNSFIGIGEFGPYVRNKNFNGTPQGVACLLYQIATESVPSELGGGGAMVPTETFQWAASQLNTIFSSGVLVSFGCPLVYD